MLTHFESSSTLLCLSYSPWSDFHAEGDFSGLAMADNVCSLAQVAQAIAEVKYQGHEQFLLLVVRPQISTTTEVTIVMGNRGVGVGW